MLRVQMRAEISAALRNRTITDLATTIDQLMTRGDAIGWRRMDCSVSRCA